MASDREFAEVRGFHQRASAKPAGDRWAHMLEGEGLPPRSAGGKALIGCRDCIGLAGLKACSTEQCTLAVSIPSFPDGRRFRRVECGRSR